MSYQHKGKFHLIQDILFLSSIIAPWSLQIFLIKYSMQAKSLQSCLTLCDTMDSSLPCSSGHGIPQARILVWVAMPSSRESFWPRDRMCVSYISYIGRLSFTTRGTWEAQQHFLLVTKWVMITWNIKIHPASGSDVRCFWWKHETTDGFQRTLVICVIIWIWLTFQSFYLLLRNWIKTVYLENKLIAKVGQTQLIMQNVW